MREKELRIALVCFGGVSLAVYMHGISKEILKLVRASAAYHNVSDRIARAKASYSEVSRRAGAETDTEEIYFDLLREIGRDMDLRIIVDIVAGASAGGINGTMLARAISHDLPIQPLRDLWLDNADVNVLLAREARAGSWSKVALKPFFWGAGATGYIPSFKDPEVRKNLSLFVRSRWFKPPLDGLCMSGLMYDAINAMGDPARGSSLLPSGQRLDLFVTLTDYHGQLHLVQIHDPPLIHEREHRHVLHFGFRRTQAGALESDFDLEGAPGLAFAARATSSFPGVFPPAQIAEIDQLLRDRGAAWPRRQQFLERNFPRYVAASVDPTFASFIDGSVLNNRPFREAIGAIHGRPAYRQAERRLVYIEPNPSTPVSRDRLGIPGFFATVRGAISDLPRAQPVTDDLAWVLGFNSRMRDLRGIIEGARPQVTRYVDSILPATLDWSDAGQITTWREEMNAQLARESGFAYPAYVRLKLASILRFVSHTVSAILGVPDHSPMANAVTAAVEAWAIRSRIVYETADAASLHAEGGTDAQPLAPWAAFLLKFDLDYRKRRLNFLIEGQNRIYQRLSEGHYPGLDAATVNRLKRNFYAGLDNLRRREDWRLFSIETHALASEVFPSPPSASDARNLQASAHLFVETHHEQLTALVDRLAREIDLGASTRDVDLLLAAMDPADWPADARRDVLVTYLGFPYWDLLTFPVALTREPGEFREILVDRISPLDARTFSGGPGAVLKGTGFANFAGFLSRSYRENDYVLGRLHAIDRMIDIVCDAAEIGFTSDRLDIAAFKKRAFLAVLNAEEPHLTSCRPLINTLRNLIRDL
ncbi:MAG: patatin-like protein [Hyphomicrobium sp.]|uniref:patatin-like protein n=1 Tax=Hyphomicrobium sp. TaxID=82 RepID=UPI003D13C79F